MTGTAKIKTLIVDDETLARRRIRRLLATEGDVEVIGECGDSQQAIDFIQERNPDLVFLDVQMPGMDGFSVVESLPPQTKPAVIFVTAFDQYALRAFDVHALDYLMKPFDRARFRKALDRARNQMRQRSPVVLDEQITKLLDSLQPKPPERLVIKSAGRIMFLRKDEIDWIEAASNYVKLYSCGKGYLVRHTIGDLERKLDSRQFLRIHRSIIVNIQKIRGVQPCNSGEFIITLTSGKELPSSRGYRQNLGALLKAAL